MPDSLPRHSGLCYQVRVCLSIADLVEVIKKNPADSDTHAGSEKNVLEWVVIHRELLGISERDVFCTKLINYILIYKICHSVPSVDNRYEH